MKGLFKQKPRSPLELLHRLREVLISVDIPRHSRELKRRSFQNRITELSNLLRELNLLLYGSSGGEPYNEGCVRLAQEFFKENTMRLLVVCLPKLNSDARSDTAHLLAKFLQQQAQSRWISSDYLEANKDLIDHLVSRFEDLDTALQHGIILRNCICHQSIAKYILESDNVQKFFGYMRISHFDVATDAFATFKELTTRHKSTVASFLSNRYDWFFTEFNKKLLESENYMTRRQAIKLLGNILIERSNAGVMVRYVSSKDNMKLVMNLLRETSKNIQVETFHVFKLFINNENKPQEIITILKANRSKLLRLLADLKTENEDETFQEDKKIVIKEIQQLESKDLP